MKQESSSEGTVHLFNDGAAYERFMGRWSRAAGEVFLDWMSPRLGEHWLDVGCGAGSFTALILEKCSPASVRAVDPEPAQISHARHRLAGQAVHFHLAGAQALPFDDAVFDIVTSGLVLNFVPEPLKGIAEMVRVARPGGVVSGYVWEFASDLSPTWPLRGGLRQLGIPVPSVPGSECTTPAFLRHLFERAGLEKIAIRSINVAIQYDTFDEFWISQTPAFHPMTKTIETLTREQQSRLKEDVRSRISCSDGRVEYLSRASGCFGVKSQKVAIRSSR